MKKKFLYTAIFAAMIGLASCNEDFNADVAAPHREKFLQLQA